MTEFFMWMMQVLITNSCNSLSVTNLNMINSPKSHIHVNGFEEKLDLHNVGYLVQKLLARGLRFNYDKI